MASPVSRIFFMTLLSISVVAFLFPRELLAGLSNLKYVKANNTWQADVNLHFKVNAQTPSKEMECSNYCTIRSSQFR
jgi:hypothetical protein